MFNSDCHLQDDLFFRIFAMGGAIRVEENLTELMGS